jgi:hypothetical protein
MNRFKVADTDYTAKAAQLRQRLAEIEDKLALLIERRKAFALDAVSQDKPALIAIEKIDTEAAALRRERDTASDAIEHLERLQREQLAENERKDRARREAEGRKLADAVLAISGEIDGSMVALRTLFEQRAVVLRQLGDTRTVSSNYLLRLHQKFLPSAAARKAGLERYLALEHIPVPNISTLVDSTSGLRGPLTALDKSEDKSEEAA